MKQFGIETVVLGPLYRSEERQGLVLSRRPHRLEVVARVKPLQKRDIQSLTADHQTGRTIEPAAEFRARLRRQDGVRFGIGVQAASAQSEACRKRKCGTSGKSGWVIDHGNPANGTAVAQPIGD